MSSLLRRLIRPVSKLAPESPRQQRETVPLTLPDGREVSVLRVRDPRARRIKLLVSESGARLTVPTHASLREAQRFLLQHADWLAVQLLRRAAVAPPAPFGGSDGGPLPLRGERLPLTWREGRALRVDRDLHGFVITRPEKVRDASIRRALKEFYLGEARRDIGQWLPRYTAGLPRAPRLIRLRPLRSLWGSLSADASLSLDLALVLGPPAAFEYVLVHELCHLIHANHSRAFWREVEIRCPDWRAHRQWFRAEGLGMKNELARLVAG